MTLRAIDPHTPPPALLSRIQERFREMGVFEKTLMISHEGQKYLARCDSQAFTVYRLNQQCRMPPGAPGWPVALVTRETAVDETGPPTLLQDEFASGLTLVDWLELIEERYGVG